jgi:hypothetical protein
MDEPKHIYHLLCLLLDPVCFDSSLFVAHVFSIYDILHLFVIKVIIFIILPNR